MARGRMINQTIDFDPEFNALSIEAQLMYLRTLPFLDRDGLIFGHPRALLGKVAPMLEQLDCQISDIIDEWVAQGLVICYTAKIGNILFFKGFAKNQSGMHYDRESPSRFDPPPGWTHGPKGLIRIESDLPREPDSEATENNNEDLQEDSEPTPTQPKSDMQIESCITQDDIRIDSGVSPAQIEVKDQDQLQDQLTEKEETHARDPLAVAWQQAYADVAMPPKLASSLKELSVECGIPAAIHGIKASAAKEDGRNFRYIAECARNYVPPAPLASYASELGYQVDLPGVHILEPPATNGHAPPPLPPPVAHDDPWAIALAELAGVLPGSAPHWLEGSRLEASGELAGEPLYRVILTNPRANAQWLSQQAEPAVRKKLASLLRKRILLEFVNAAQELAP